MARREFHFSEGTSNKFWAIELEGSSFEVHFGRVGTAGQAQGKTFADEAAARKEYEKLIAEKVRKGYRETGGVAQAPPPAVAKALPEAEAAPAQPTPVVAAPPALAEFAVAEPAANAEAEVAPLERRVRLEPEDSELVPWLDRPAPFDRADAVARLRSIENPDYNPKARDGQEKYRWENAKIPPNPSREEAAFWVAVAEAFRSRKLSTVADEMAVATHDPVPTPATLIKLFCASLHLPNLGACLAVLLPPAEFLAPPPGDMNAKIFSAYGLSRFREYYRPYLSAADREALYAVVVPRIPPDLADEHAIVFAQLAGELGHPEPAARLLALLDDRALSQGTIHYNLRQQVDELIFSLCGREQVLAEHRRLGASLSGHQVGRWLALTGVEGLDALAVAICAETVEEKAAALAEALHRVVAPEAAGPALQVRMGSKVPGAGQAWLDRHPREAAAGLTPLAMGKGKLADAAREQLRMQRRRDADVLVSILPHLETSEREWLRREILESAEASLAAVPRAALPHPLAAALGGAAAQKLKGSAWLKPEDLPPIRVGEGRLADADVVVLLAELKATPLGTRTPLLDAIADQTERRSLEEFLWRLFEAWEQLDGAGKEKWALGAIGHLGSDALVLKLTPLIRNWPGESQHQRAVFGLEVLRAIGSDAALMALNGIAQKLKFAALKQKAQGLMEEIAQARGLDREQLADRIVPDCGLDQDGGRVFDFGPRQFRFVLGPDLKALVRDGDGKVRPDLPAPTRADDAALAEEAVAEWKQLKKQLKDVLQVQVERLEDAMIAGRRWTAAELPALFVSQPLIVNLARRLIFAGYGPDGRVAATFRIAEDGTFADSDDVEVALPSLPIGLVHPAQLSDAEKSAWGQLLSDYRIVQPFEQLGRTIREADPADLGATAITRYRGPKIPGIAVYGTLERAHWRRDTPADGGGFSQHSKYFPGAGLTAFIAYTPGMAIGWYEEDQEIDEIYFVAGHLEPEMWGHHAERLKIREVDPVVLSEVLGLADKILSKAS